MARQTIRRKTERTLPLPTISTPIGHIAVEKRYYFSGLAMRFVEDELFKDPLPLNVDEKRVYNPYRNDDHREQTCRLLNYAMQEHMSDEEWSQIVQWTAMQKYQRVRGNLRGTLKNLNHHITPLRREVEAYNQALSDLLASGVNHADFRDIYQDYLEAESLRWLIDRVVQNDN